MNARTTVRSVTVLAMLTVMSLAPVTRAEFKTPTAITNVTLVVEPGVKVESGTILIADGRIVDAGADVEIPPDAERIDAKGLIAYAGLIDGQSHLGIPELTRKPEDRQRVEDVSPDPKQAALPATRFADRRGIRAEFRALELYAPTEKQLDAQRTAGFTTALVAPRDGIFSGESDVMNLSDAPIRRAVVLTEAAMHGSFTTGEEGDYPQTLLGVIAEFRQVLLDVERHAKMLKYAQRHPATASREPTDAALDALQPLLARTKRLIFEANSENEINRALDLAKEFNLDIAVSGGKEAWKVAARLKAERVPLIISIEFDDEPEYGKKKEPREGKRRGSEAKEPEGESGEAKPESPEEKEEGEAKGGEKKKEKEKIDDPLKLRKEKRRLWEEQVVNIIRLHEAGVPFSLRTRDFKKVSEFWTNLRKVIERGLTEDALLAALTTTPAEALGLKDQLGVIRAGRLANLTLLDKPIIDKKAKTKFVFIDGKKFEIDEDKTGNDERPGAAAQRRSRPGGPPEIGLWDCADEQPPEEDQPHEHPAQGEKSTQPGEPPQEKPESPTPAKETKEEEDKGPDFAVEIEADRVPKTRTGGNVMIQNATIIPVSSPTLERSSILVRNGKIEAIGQTLTVPEGVTLIDATGKFVIPGLVDCHSHLGIDGVNEAALAISAEVRIADLINPQSVGIYRAAAGGVTTHHVLHGSANPIGGQNAIVKTNYGRSAREMLVDAPPTIKFALGENVTRANSSQGFGQRFPGTRMGVEAVIRGALEAGKAYQTEWDAYQTRLRAGEDVPPPRRDLRLEALSRIVSGELTVHAHCYRSDEILRLLHTAEDYGFRIGTLQHVLEGYRIAPEIARHGCGASTFSNFWAYKIEAFGAIPHNAALMTEHGVNASINSDSPNTIRFFGLEAAKSIKWGGLDENQALRLVTLNPAMQLQLDDRIGSLEVGKDGDLAIFNGHPLNTFAKNVMTIIEGEVYFEDPNPDPTEPADTLKLPGAIDRTIPQTPHRAYAIVGATIHPISGPAIENGTVVIVDEKIQAVGAGATVPPGAGVIDAKGLHVYPGLIDAGSQLGLAEIGSTRSTNDNADIADFDPNLHAASAVHPHSEHIRIARTAGITTTLAVPSGGVISGQSAVIHLEGWTVDEMLVADDFGLHVTIPSDPQPFGRRRLTDEELKRRKEEVKKQKRDLEEFVTRAAHYAEVKALAAKDAAIKHEVDLKLEAMVPYVRGEKPVVFEANAYREMLDAIEFAEKHKLRIVLRGATQAWKIADELAKKDIPVILGSTLTYPRGDSEPWDSIYRCAGVLARAGVRFCFASGDASSAYDLGFDAGMAVAHGLTKEKAEYALTLGAAKILGIDERVGSIEPGKLADLIVTTDTPLQAVSQVSHMFIAGAPIELTSLHTESYERFKNRPEPHLKPARTDLRGPKSLTKR